MIYLRVFRNIILILICFLQILYNLRMFAEFSHFVELFGKCLARMKYFIIFLFIGLAAFSLILQAIGAEISNDDYSYDGLNIFAAYFILAFRISLGDFTLPTTTFWSK